MSRTYDKLETYHYEYIKEQGYAIGDTVWFTASFLDEIRQGVIINFDIHYEGDIQFDIEYEVVREWELSEQIWTADEKHRRGRTVDKEFETAFMYRVAKSEADVKKLLMISYQNEISQCKSKIRYLQDKIKDLK